jgi:uncharacterized membrane protein YjjP (DUF1212 family)
MENNNNYEDRLLTKVRRQNIEDLRKLNEKPEKTPYYVYIFLLFHLGWFLEMYRTGAYLNFLIHLGGFLSMYRRLFNSKIQMRIQVPFSLACFIVSYAIIKT